MGTWWKSHHANRFGSEGLATPECLLVPQIRPTEATDNPYLVRNALPHNDLDGIRMSIVGTLWKPGEDLDPRPAPHPRGCPPTARGIVGKSHVPRLEQPLPSLRYYPHPPSKSKRIRKPSSGRRDARGCGRRGAPTPRRGGFGRAAGESTAQHGGAHFAASCPAPPHGSPVRGSSLGTASQALRVRGGHESDPFLRAALFFAKKGLQRLTC